MITRASLLELKGKMRDTNEKLLNKKYDTIYGYKATIIDDYEELGDKKGLRGIDKDGFTGYYERSELYLKKKKKRTAMTTTEEEQEETTSTEEDQEEPIEVNENG